jgi:hypothetical protein
MDAESLRGYATLSSAVIAAIASGCNLWLQLRGKRDRFMVVLGGGSPSIDRETMMHVVSRSDHTIHLSDWGFIEPSGAFTSIPLEADASTIFSEELVQRGSSKIEKFGDIFEAGYERNLCPAGAYACSTTQRGPRVAFARDFPRLKRWYIRGRLLVQPHYLTWSS